jgi:hypothetical protein
VGAWGGIGVGDLEARKKSSDEGWGKKSDTFGELGLEFSLPHWAAVGPHSHTEMQSAHISSEHFPIIFARKFSF